MEQDRNRASTDGVARLMLNKYTFRDNAEIVGKSYSPGEKVSLTPRVLRLPKSDSPVVEFRVGLRGARGYLVRDIFEFVENIRHLNKVTYGKQLTFIHSMESFDGDSARLVRFVVDKCEEVKSLMRMAPAEGGISPISDKRRLPLTPTGCDRLFALFAKRRIRAAFGAMPEEDLPVVDENPVLEITLAGEDNDSITLSVQPFGLVLGEERVYIQQGGKLFCCDPSFSESCRDFLSAMEKNRFSLRIVHQDLARFCSYVLPVIRRHMEFNGEVERLDEFRSSQLETQIYLDAPERNVITARMVYRYDDLEIDFYAAHFSGQRIDHGCRNLRDEMWVRILLSKYFHYYDTVNKVLRLEAEDEELYRFIHEGIESLMEVAAVHMTDRFSKIGLIAPPAISIGVSLRSGLLDLEIDTGEFPPEELTGVLTAYRENHKYYRLTDGRYLKLEDTALGGLASIADGLELSQKHLLEGRAEVPAYRALYLNNVLRENANIRFRREDSFIELVREIKASFDSAFKEPASLRPILRNYQKTGFRWIKMLEKYHFSGILADDMGLGKTLQVIALLLSAKEQGGGGTSIVVCPTSLVFNWARELQKFAPALSSCCIIGDSEERKAAIDRLAENDVLITSYDLLRRDRAHYREIEFTYTVIDEAQYIKNHRTQNAQAVKGLKSLYRLALTGTPIENRLSELWSIFDFLMPGYLYSYAKFRSRFEEPVVRARDDASLQQLKRLISPFILRRTKSEVLTELPAKSETVIQTPMVGEQRKLYLANVERLRKQLQENSAREQFVQQRFHLFAQLTRLRQICCDPALCYDAYAGPSAKLDLCIELLRESVDGGHKVLVFSQFTTMLDRIEEKLREEDIRYYVLKGDTPKEKRAQNVERFQSDDTPVFLISLKAGGTGLNLTAADVVIHYDPWWNLAAQNQASDRVHRIGQKNSVQVYKLIASESIEERILQLQEAKSALAGAVIDGADGSSLFELTAEELLNLLN